MTGCTGDSLWLWCDNGHLHIAGVEQSHLVNEKCIWCDAPLHIDNARPRRQERDITWSHLRWAEISNHGSASPPRPMQISVNEELILIQLKSMHRNWFTAMDLGGFGGSHHSATFARLVAKGFVEERQEEPPPDERRKGTRGSQKEYKITPSGVGYVNYRRRNGVTSKTG